MVDSRDGRPSVDNTALSLRIKRSHPGGERFGLLVQPDEGRKLVVDNRNRRGKRVRGRVARRRLGVHDLDGVSQRQPDVRELAGDVLCHREERVPLARGVIRPGPLLLVQLLRLPLRSLCHPARGCVVALWVTNRERIRRFVSERLLAAWGLELVTTWTWLKLASSCVESNDTPVPVLPLDGSAGGRRPYEQLLLCRTAWGDDSLARACEALPRAVVMLCPPAEHSRKPRLLRMLQERVGGEVAELFARELTEGGTAWGDEPLRFNV